MKAYRIYSGRKQDALELIEHTVSNPTVREVRVRVRAVAVCGSTNADRREARAAAVISSRCIRRWVGAGTSMVPETPTRRRVPAPPAGSPAGA